MKAVFCTQENQFEATESYVEIVYYYQPTK